MSHLKFIKMKAAKKLLLIVVFGLCLTTANSTTNVGEPEKQLPEVYVICDKGNSGWCHEITLSIFDVQGCNILNCDWTGHPSDICPGFIVKAVNVLGAIGASKLITWCLAI
jgi:hypothetical protein